MQQNAGTNIEHNHTVYGLCHILARLAEFIIGIELQVCITRDNIHLLALTVCYILLLLKFLLLTV